MPRHKENDVVQPHACTAAACIQAVIRGHKVKTKTKQGEEDAYLFGAFVHGKETWQPKTDEESGDENSGSECEWEYHGGSHYPQPDEHRCKHFFV